MSEVLEGEEPVQNISYEELVQALKSTRIWVRRGPVEPTAFLMHVLHPEDAARGLFLSVQAAQEKEAACELCR